MPDLGISASPVLWTRRRPRTWRPGGVAGTMGYIAPECFHTGKATQQSDVYAFGVVLLEIVCGLRPGTTIDEFNFLVDWVWSLHREGRILDAVEERLGDDTLDEEKISSPEVGGMAGTLGYVVLECFLTGKATKQPDVYAFGVVLCEIVCGLRPETRIDEFHF
ncbi:hypothetical protein RHGRI_022540 [Rhododendron griersonianum]|uniref:Protein kinase domain-containing protein n=1 Tax=Rhododendron griersonianum TaxID=479676 RepID=A0AAV6IZV2_9ERIC|nr:hypothetical protein RHGRI_022540 [Rhododendron griersonianum]